VRALGGKKLGSAYGIRTRVTAVRGRRPGPLDECAVVVLLSEAFGLGVMQGPTLQRGGDCSRSG
jgi:hypothetical protein